VIIKSNNIKYEAQIPNSISLSVTLLLCELWAWLLLLFWFMTSVPQEIIDF